MSRQKPTEPDPPVRGWCHCDGAVAELHYMLNGLLLCGRRQKATRPFRSNTVAGPKWSATGAAPSGAPADTAPRCRDCEELHLQMWKNGGAGR